MRLPLLRAMSLLLLLAVPAAAQSPAGPAGWYQAEGYYHAVTNDFGDWKGVGVGFHLPAGDRTIWNISGLAQEAFNDKGVWLGASHRYQLSPDWFSQVSVGGGTGEYHLPDFRTDLTLGKSWLNRRNLLTMVSGTYVDAKQGYSDIGLQGSVVLYLPGAALEAGGRMNWSNPNAVSSGRAIASATLGRERQRVIVLRGSGGGEGYQLTGTGATEQKFTSWEASLSWREWISDKVGMVSRLEFYDNPFYTRTGLSLGVFRHW